MTTIDTKAIGAPILYDRGEVKVTGKELDQILWQGREWSVTTFGLERRDGCYAIEARRLLEGMRDDQPNSWVRHVRDRERLDINDFTTAFLIACAVFRRRLRQQDVELVMWHRHCVAEDRALQASRRNGGGSRAARRCFGAARQRRRIRPPVSPGRVFRRAQSYPKARRPILEPQRQASARAEETADDGR